MARTLTLPSCPDAIEESQPFGELESSHGCGLSACVVGKGCDTPLCCSLVHAEEEALAWHDPSPCPRVPTPSRAASFLGAGIITWVRFKRMCARKGL